MRSRDNNAWSVYFCSGDPLGHFATIGGSTYVDSVTGHNVIGLVAQLSYFDPNSDYTTNGNGNGLYATVVEDDIGPHDQWTEVSGIFLGLGGGSRADFTNTAILPGELTDSCGEESGICLEGCELLAPFQAFESE